MTDMDALIARLEQASEGSRELDREIRRAICAAETQKIWDGRTQGVMVEISLAAAYYTTSIDAALTLAPAGFIEMRRYSDGWYVKVMQSSEHPAEHLGTQKPAALALCIAALKAKARRPA